MSATSTATASKTDKVTVRAAGAVVWRPARKGPEVALIHRPRYDDWSFPKGKLDAGESYLAAAVREVREETGLPVLVGRRLPTQVYEVSMAGARRWKRVKYWAARAAGDLDFEPNDEVDRLEWLPVSLAVGRLTRTGDVDLLESFATLPVDTFPLVLLRHGEAVPRKQWSGASDAGRPLTAIGREQARSLVPLLGAYGETALVSSDATRCVETVEPYRRDAGLDLRLEPALSEAAHKSDPKAAKKWLRGALKAGRPVIACSHRPVFPSLLSGSVPGAVVQAGKRQLAPAEAWVLHVRDAEVISVDRLKA